MLRSIVNDDDGGCFWFVRGVDDGKGTGEGGGGRKCHRNEAKHASILVAVK